MCESDRQICLLNAALGDTLFSLWYVSDKDTLYMSDASLWAGKAKLNGASGFTQAPDR